MSDDPPAAASAPSPGVTALLVVLGVILLLPGLCVAVMAMSMLPTEDVVRLATRDPIFQMILVLWGICLVISLGGVFLLRHASRRARMHRP